MTTSEREQRGRRGPVRQVPLPARPGRTAAGVTSPGNTAEPSGEPSKGDVVIVGEVLLAVAGDGPAPEPATEDHGE